MFVLFSLVFKLLEDVWKKPNKNNIFTLYHFQKIEKKKRFWTKNFLL